MKEITEEYDVVKVNASNFVDCLLVGKGIVLEVDPDHDILFLYRGVIGFFSHFKENEQQENIDEEMFCELLNGLRGIAFLDTLGEPVKS